MNRYRVLDFIRGTSIVRSRDFYLRLMTEPNLNSEARSLQKTHLIAFLKRLRNNDYYGALLQGFSDEQIEIAPYEVLGFMPITDKGFLTANSEYIRNKKLPAEKSYTGGSTGSPFHYYSGKRMISSLSGYTLFLWTYLAGYDWSDDIIVIGGTSIGDNRNLKKVVLHFLQRRRFISGGEINEKNATELADLINKAKKPVLLYGYPSSICQYITILNRMHTAVNTSNIKNILTTSETLTAERHDLIRSFLGKDVINLYGARDGGISAGSSDNQRFIYNGIDCVAESIEIDGVKELILTNLDSDAFPFVRYRIGDIADIVSKTEGYPFEITNLQGRTRDFIHISPNCKLHGSVINTIFKDMPIVEYQIFQHKDYSCDIYLQPTSVLSAKDMSILSSSIEQSLGSTPFKIHVVDKLKREENNKLKNIISEIPD